MWWRKTTFSFRIQARIFFAILFFIVSENSHPIRWRKIFYISKSNILTAGKPSQETSTGALLICLSIIWSSSLLSFTPSNTYLIIWSSRIVTSFFFSRAFRSDIVIDWYFKTSSIIARAWRRRSQPSDFCLGVACIVFHFWNCVCFGGCHLPILFPIFSICIKGFDIKALLLTIPQMSGFARFFFL